MLYKPVIYQITPNNPPLKSWLRSHGSYFCKLIGITIPLSNREMLET